MTTATASSQLVRPRAAGLPSRLAQGLRWAARRLMDQARKNAQRDVSEIRQRDIAHVRKLAQQVRLSNPGYANDLEAAAAAFEAQDAAR